ncbi:YbaK/EbsC family protein [Rhodobacteraceae bacterium RKSG542]|uniref:YbaK/EbsC family protein n=1 Tax=Pseudovibrio flavus TaxID=2529854 RepID=UPI0012BD158A|nr:YbaK/EbsC family protein [Pseudovibrio flavus]MTI18380.1 YbaK/EbsC family protein [Pseudovibrio flavus]
MLKSKRARQFQGILDEKGLDLEVIELPDTARSVVEAALALKTAEAQILKSLVFKAEESGDAILVLASGSNRVNEDTIATLVGGPIVRPDAKFVKDVTGFSIGGIPPLGHKNPLTVFVDEDLFTFDEVWAAAGSPHAVFCIAGNLSNVLPEHSVVSIK